jgi:hypothetical protein
MANITVLTAGPNPIGVAQPTDEIQQFINNMAIKWEESTRFIKSSVKPTWFSWGPMGLISITKFLIYCLDGLIVLVENLVTEDGANKKATVLSAASALYDYVIKDTLPFYLKPFSGQIKDFIIYTLLSIIIDFIVEKYNDKNWGNLATK